MKSQHLTIIVMLASNACTSPPPSPETPVTTQPRALAGIHYDPPRRVEDIRALDHHGERFVLSRQPHPLSMVFFGYVGCTDVCPTNLKRFKKIQELLGERARQVQFIFVTIDPAREGPAKLREHLEALGGEIVGVTGSPLVLNEVYKQWGIIREQVEVDKAVDPRGFKYNHTGQIFLIKGGEQLVVSYPYGTEAQVMSDDLKLLLMVPSARDEVQLKFGTREVIIPSGSYTLRAQKRPALPSYLRLRPGESIKWINKDYMYHTVGDIRLAPESSATQRFDQPGTYYLGCTALPDETIRIKVEGEAIKAHTIKIPSGTYANRRGASFPPYLEVEAGDIIIWRNDDHYFHVIADMTVAPDEQLSQRLDTPGDYTFGCSALPNAIMHIRVKPPL